MVEHRGAVSYYVLLSANVDRDSGVTALAVSDAGTGANRVEDVPVAANHGLRGATMTSLGPAPYKGDILDNPDVVWMDDVWTPEEEEEAERFVAGKGAPLSTFWREKFERESRKSWDLFYARNGDHFFKDRHYLGIVFSELVETAADAQIAQALTLAGALGDDVEGNDSRGLREGRLGRRTLLELGCGVGNAVFPILAENRGLYVVAVDLSPRAIGILKQHPLYRSGRCEAHVLDARSDELPEAVLEAGGVDLVLLQFSISAVAVSDMGRVARLVERALRPGGKLLLRDYGRFDEAQLRFAKGRRLGENLYVRQDGTTSYFFSLEDVRQIFCGAFLTHDQTSSSCSVFGQGASLVEEELKYVRRQYANRAQGVARRRVWVHGKFRKANVAKVRPVPEPEGDIL